MLTFQCGSAIVLPMSTPYDITYRTEEDRVFIVPGTENIWYATDELNEDRVYWLEVRGPVSSDPDLAWVDVWSSFQYGPEPEFQDGSQEWYGYDTITIPFDSILSAEEWYDWE